MKYETNSTGADVLTDLICGSGSWGRILSTYFHNLDFKGVLTTYSNVMILTIHLRFVSQITERLNRQQGNPSWKKKSVSVGSNKELVYS